jgi:hypothetical protein
LTSFAVRYALALASALGPFLILGLSLGALALVAFGKVADDVMEKESQQLDDFVLYGLRQFQSPQLDAVARIISALGSEIVALALIVFLVFFLIRHRYGYAVVFL